MATPGTADYRRKRHNLTIGDHTWEAIRDRAHNLHIPAGELVDRALRLVAFYETETLRSKLTPNDPRPFDQGLLDKADLAMRTVPADPS